MHSRNAAVTVVGAVVGSVVAVVVVGSAVVAVVFVVVLAVGVVFEVALVEVVFAAGVSAAGLEADTEGASAMADMATVASDTASDLALA